ncbi:MAG: sodium-dependent transporter [Planctomycetes bacterium]|nr:sodium-dependent transporter [Planctomycetota bacterium]
MSETPKREQWASRVGLVLAMAGNAVGLGNFLRFPAQAAKNGGGAFLIPYLVALVVVGLPLIWVEWAMGRYGGQQGHHSTPGVFQSFHRNRVWKYFGVMGLWVCLTIASYYLYIETWCLAYAGFSAVNGFHGMTPAAVGGFFRQLTGEREYEMVAISAWGMLLFLLCICLNVFILSKGLAKGIEIVSKIGMPLLIVFAFVLAARGLMISPQTDELAKVSPMVGLNFVWQPRFTALADPSVWLAAAGQIFFTLSIGMGTIHCYSSYLREHDDIALTGATAAWTNEFCEVLLGGTILIPIAVAYLGLPEVVNLTSGGSGFGLGFLVFPTLFNNWGAFAPAAGVFWFGLLFFAAITSSLAMGQPVMAFLQEEFKFSRERSAITFGMLLLPLAIPVAILNSQTFNDEFDYWASTFMLVVFALGETILFAWMFGMNRGWAEMMKGAELQIPIVFKYIIQYVTPVFLALILVGSVFQPKAGWQPYLAVLAGGQAPPAWEWDSGSVVGKLLHRDVADARKSKLHGIDAEIEELKLSAADLAKRIQSLQDEITKVGSDTHLIEYERDARVLKLEEQIKAMTALGELSADARTSRVNELTETRSKAELFYSRLPFVRNLDRLVMIGVYAFFTVLVWIAWRKRTSEGRT